MPAEPAQPAEEPVLVGAVVPAEAAMGSQATEAGPAMPAEPAAGAGDPMPAEPAAGSGEPAAAGPPAGAKSATAGEAVWTVGSPTAVEAVVAAQALAPDEDLVVDGSVVPPEAAMEAEPAVGASAVPAPAAGVPVVPPEAARGAEPVTDVPEASAAPAPVGPAPVEPEPPAWRQERPLPSIERVLSGPSRDRNLSWHTKVKVVAGSRQGPGARDQEALDRARARLPLAGPRRVLVLGCTSGAGQSVTALMTGHILASLREELVAAVDLHDGTLARCTAPAATVRDVLNGARPQAQPSASPDGLHLKTRAGGQRSVPPARLDIIASEGPLADGEELRLAENLGQHYPLSFLDPGPTGLTRLLKVADQLVIVAPASAEAASALAATRDWLDAHGFGELAMHSVTLLNGVSRRSLPDVEAAEAVARGRCRAIVRVPWDDMLNAGATSPSALHPQARVAYAALAGVVVAGMAAAPVRRPR